MALAQGMRRRHHVWPVLGCFEHRETMSDQVGLAPFTSTHSDDFPAILAGLNVSLVLSTYQSGKLAFLSPTPTGITQLLRTFDNPMGLALDQDRLAVACRNEVLVLSNDARAGRTYPRKPDYYDAFFVPRSAHFTGPLDIHDMAWDSQGSLVVVNTRFSCLASLSSQHSFDSTWQPGFVDALEPEDRCHLNGLALDKGKPRFVTALGATNTAGGWRDAKLNGGVLLDVESGETIVHGLAMPHSPRMVEGSLYVLNSAQAQLLCVDPNTGRDDVVTNLPGFARGLAHHGDYLFVGLSEVRKTNQTFGDLPLARQQNLFCGVAAVHIGTGTIAGYFRYLRSAKEIYDVQVVPNLLKPGILGTADSRHQEQISSAQGVWWAQEASKS